MAATLSPRRRKIRRIRAKDLCQGRYKQGRKRCTLGFLTRAVTGEDVTTLPGNDDMRDYQQHPEAILAVCKEFVDYVGLEKTAYPESRVCEYNNLNEPEVVAETLNGFLESKGLLKAS